jgi:hypothetical protein
MPVYKNIGGTWTIVKHIWKNVGGTWTKVRRAFKNVGGTWIQYHGDNDFKAFSLGLLQTQTTASNGGLWVNNVQQLGTVRSWSILAFDKYGNITFSRSYDIFGEATAGSPSATAYGSAQFAADVAAIATGSPFVIVTYDEPANGAAPVETGVSKGPIAAFVNALTSIGASSSALNSIPYRGAYMLLGTKGAAASFEAVRGTEQTNLGSGGTDSGTLDGAIEVTFNIVNGAFANITRVM